MTAVDFEEFLWIWNRRQKQATPAPHRRIARWLSAMDQAGERRLLLQAFRGCGKSTLIGLWCAWQLRRRPHLRILVLAADQALATRMVATVRRILERHPLCGFLLPQNAEAWAMDRFTVARPGVLREPSMLAQGITGNFTGARADIIIGDDVEVAGNCDTPAKRSELRERLAEAEFVLTPDGTMLFAGTPHTAESLYAEGTEAGAFLAGYARLLLPLLDDTGASAWPQRFSAEVVSALRARVGTLHFNRQMLLQPQAAAALRLDPALLLRYAEDSCYSEAQGHPQLQLLGRRMVSGGGFWDPAYGRPGKGDASVLAATYADAEGNHYLHRLRYLTHQPEAAQDPATQQCQQVAALARELLLPVVRVETNGIGRFLPALLRQEMARAGAACSVAEHVSRRNKSERILAALEPALAARRLYAHESVFRTPFPREMAEWAPETPGLHDDALDALAGCLLAEPVRLQRLPPAARGMSWRG